MYWNIFIAIHSFHSVHIVREQFKIIMDYGFIMDSRLYYYYYYIIIRRWSLAVGACLAISQKDHWAEKGTM